MSRLVRACVFDAYGTLFDVNAAVIRNADAFGGDAQEFADLWRARQLEYSWTRSLMNRYTDFCALTEESLVFALRTFGLEEQVGLKHRLLRSYLELDPYPDTLGTLQQLKALGFTNAVLSNGTRDMLQAALTAGNLKPYVDACLSVDELKIYKPAPRAYQIVCDRLGVVPSEVLFVSSNPWDLAGASCFGFHAVRINRRNASREYEFAALYGELESLSDLPSLLQDEAD